ncbi:MAG: hypothetical protein K5929_09230 [Lachnospiraceae bacterium]|nr:hypothetical protein [Lachnospiraceae bacterium]
MIVCLSVLMMFLLTACGEAMYELTPDEEAIITSYAAHIVAKYNKSQPEGYTYVYVSDEEETAEDEPSPEETVSGNEAEADAGEQETVSGDEAVSGDETKTSDKSGNGLEDESETSQIADNGTAMAEALGIKGARLVYTGIQFTSIYDTVYPEAGNKLMILHFSLVNEKDSALKVSVLDVSPVFRASLNGEDAVTGDISILSDDLSTFAGKIPAGESDNVMLLFQVPVDASESVDSLKLQIRADGSSTTFILQ